MLCLSPAPAAADFIVSFDLNSAKLDYDYEDDAGDDDQLLTITENIGSDILLRYEDGVNVLAIQTELEIPVKYIGVGEQIDDLQPFVSGDFARALFE